MIRWTKWCDREEIRNLWHLRFSDSEPFIDWFFRERFSPDHSAVSIEDGRIVSSIQSYPVHIRIRDAILPCTIIAGVSTVPAYEGHGHMGRTMRFYMNGIGARGGAVVSYRPEIISMYSGFGHYPVSRTAYFHIDDPGSLAAETCAVPLDLRNNEAAIQACYFRFSRYYSGMISRSLADMRLKLADYAADGARGIGIFEGDTLCGYCVYFTGECLYAEELVTYDPIYREILLRALCQTALVSGKTVAGKLPPDTRFSEASVAAQIRLDPKPMNVMGVADVSTLLAAVCGCPNWRVAVTDHTVAANNGVFDFAGHRSDGTPQFCLETGRLAQFLCGYHSLAELADAGHVVLSAPCVREIDACFPVIPGYTLDEY